MKMHSGITRRLLLGTLLGLCAATALPQVPTTLYTVEIVVFRGAGEAAALPDTDLPAVTDGDVELTPASTGKLNAAAAKLRGRNSGFKVLAQAAWTQAPAAWTQAPVTLDSRRGVSAAQLNLGNGITGKLILERERVLHLGVDLVIEDAGHRYRINEMRAVKPNQIQYFDHPSVGVLAVVTAVAG